MHACTGSPKEVLQNALPTIQLVLEGVMLINYTISKVPDFVRKRFKEAFYEKQEELGAGATEVCVYVHVMCVHVCMCVSVSNKHSMKSRRSWALALQRYVCMCM